MSVLEKSEVLYKNYYSLFYSLFVVLNDFSKFIQNIGFTTIIQGKITLYKISGITLYREY